MPTNVETSPSSNRTKAPMDGNAPLAPAVLSTLNPDGTRRWLTPRPSPGRFMTARRSVAFLLIAIFTALPFLKIGGMPVILLDVAHREFTLFGKLFLPTDTLLLAILLVMCFLTIFLVTAFFGRLWCGWACPQTVYLEFIFRPLERLFTGTPGRRKNWLQSSGAGRGLKYVTYFAISFYLAHTFLSYFVGVETLAHWLRRSPLEHPSSFIIVCAVTAAMMFNFTWFREQTCTIVCPYGRFQSVMLDRNSLIISYDRARGEPRGRGSKKGGTRDVSLPVLDGEPDAKPLGDCVDCSMCVTTCPTGIDIRNGLQMECIGCAQCIDACDAVMAKLQRPTGLIRYSSQEAMASGHGKIIRPRVIVYAALLSVIMGVFVTLLVTKKSADVLVMRGLGAPFAVLETGEIGNQLRLRIANRGKEAATYRVSASGAEGARVAIEGDEITLERSKSRVIPMLVAAPPKAFTRGKARVEITVTDGKGFSRTTEYQLMGPGNTHSLPAPTPPGEGHHERRDDAESHKEDHQ